MFKKESSDPMAILNKRLIVALDTATKAQALSLVQQLLPLGVTFKVGMALYYQTGPSILDDIHSLSESSNNASPFIFLDLKLHDIPNTVKNAAFQLAYHGATFFNVHALGGKAMMQAAKEGALAGWQQRQAETPKDQNFVSGTPPKVIGVTILTSTSDEALLETLNTPLQSGTTALHLAKLAQNSGLDGVVCSAQEAPLIKEACGGDFILVTPGIRPASYAAADDQARVMTPAKALTSGSDYLVVGRPITQASDPVVAANTILAEMEVALSQPVDA